MELEIIQRRDGKYAVRNKGDTGEYLYSLSLTSMFDRYINCPETDKRCWTRWPWLARFHARRHIKRIAREIEAGIKQERGRKIVGVVEVVK